MKKAALSIALMAGLFLISQTAGATLADLHLKAGVKCTQCHKTNPPKDVPDTAVCEGCHPRDKLVAQTAKMKPTNPHDNHLGITDCNECHSVHEDKKSIPCDECHKFKFERAR